MVFDNIIFILEILIAIGIGTYHSKELLKDFLYLSRILALVPIIIFGFSMVLLISSQNFLDLFVSEFIILVTTIVYSEIAGILSAILKEIIISIFKFFN